MANGTRDVSLVIRAKNEASKSLDAIAASLDELRNAQKQTEDSGKRTGSTLEQLGVVLGKINRGLSSQEGASRFAAGLERAEKSAAGLEQSIATLIGEQQRLNTETAKTEATIGRLDKRERELSQTLKVQQAAAAQAKSGLAALTQEIAKGEKAVAGRNSSTQKFIDRLSRQQSALDKTKGRYAELAQEILRTENPSNRLLDSFEKTERRLERQSSALAKTRTSYREHQQQIDRTREALPALRREQEQLSQAFERSDAATRKTSTALGHVRQASRTAGTQLKALEKSSEATAKSLSAQSSSLTRTRNDLRELTAAGDQANQALTKVGTTVRGELIRSLRDSRRELQSYKQQWEQATAAIQRAQQDAGGMGPPTRQTHQQLETARAAKLAYQEQQQALQRLRSDLREAGTDVNRLQQAQNNYAQAVARIEQRAKALAAAQRAQASASEATAAASQRTVAAAQQQAAAQSRVARSLRTQATAGREAADAMEHLRNRGRAAMTWAQRLRGEVIALTLSYVGLYAAIEQLRGVTGAFMQIEAAQNRMLVAFNGNEALSARELRWVREEAGRLGIQFGVLAQEYSKFAIAARGSALEGDEARRIFQAVTEAARVNKLSIDQMEGTFLALSQMMSKGVVSMEELRRQMGDRLYGAFTLAAEAMGISAAELDNLVSSGSLFSERFLPKFADRLNEVFGPQLADSLDTFTTDLGRFQNEILKTQLRVAEGGFVSGLRDGLNSLSEFFQSDEGTRFFEVLGAAAGNLVRILAEVPRYFQQIAFAISLLIGMRTVAWVGTLGERFKLMLATLKPLPTSLNAAAAATRSQAAATAGLNAATAANLPLMARFQTTLRSTTALLTTANGRALLLSRTLWGLRAGLAFLGGIPGLIVTGISLAIGAWIGRTNDVIDVTGQHETQMQRLIDEYSRVRDSADEWAKAVEEGIGGITLDQARQNFRQQVAKLAEDTEAALKATAGRIESSLAVSGDLGLKDVERQVVALGRRLRSGEVTAAEYRNTLASILAEDDVPARLRDLIENSADLGQAMVDSEKRVLEAAAAVVELGGEVEELSPLLRSLIPSFEELAAAAGLISDPAQVDAIARVNAQLDEMRQKVPSLRDELKRLEDMKSIDDILETAEAIQGVESLSEPLQRLHAQRMAQLREYAQEAKRELQDAFDARRFQSHRQAISTPGASSRELSASLIRQREGFSSSAHWDVNAFRAGFGSDTVTLSDGTIQKITQGMRVSVEDANRDLERRIGELQDVVRGQVGEEAWARMNPQQQAVLTSNAYNYGSLQPSLVAAVRQGSTEGVQAALRGQASQNGGINAERRYQEAYLFGQADDINFEANLRFAEQQLEAAKQQAERAAEYNAQLDRTLQRRAEDLQYVDGISREMAIQRALEDERERSARIGVELSREQLDLIEQNAATAWDQAKAEEEVRRAKERQAEVDQRINLLQQHRRDLMEQIQFFEGQGDNAAAEELRVQLEAVTETLRRAIDSQIAFWQAAAGGPDGEEAEAAIARLQNLRHSLVETGNLALLTSRNLGQTFGEHLIMGTNNFLDKIRETGNVLQSARQAFLQFASDFLLQIAKMIMQQAIFNALQASFGGAGGFWGGVIAGVNHDGGIAGASGGTTRAVSPGWFSNAVRYHVGGIAGLKPGEVPSILERGEEVLTRDDPRHAMNGGTSGDSGSTTVINTFDAGEMVSAGLSTPAGEKVLMNWIGRNRQKVRSALG